MGIETEDVSVMAEGLPMDAAIDSSITHELCVWASQTEYQNSVSVVRTKNNIDCQARTLILRTFTHW